MFPSFQSFSYICRINAGFRSGFYWLKSGKNVLIIYAPESARAEARAEPVKGEKICWISFQFLLAEKWKKNVLIIYAPRECPSGSEGFTCKIV